MKRFATVCSGIGAPEVAASRLGWCCLFGSEIEPFPNAVRAHHFPAAPNYGDMTKYHEWPDANPDVVIAGTPCQAFSVAGLRKGLADPRGNLTLVFLGIIERYAPRWVLWENVPGVLSEKTGAFGSFLGGLAQLGYGFAYRILDAQYFGVAQRRRRVFVVAHSGGAWQRAAAVLFERESLCGNPPPRRETGQDAAPTISARVKSGGGLGTDCECDGGLIASAMADGLPSECRRENEELRNRESIPIQEIGKRQSGTPENGVGYGAPGDPMFTLQRSAVHGVCESKSFGIDSENNASEELIGTLKHLSPSGGGHPAAVMTLAIRGRGDSSDLETREDGLANAIVTPNGGRGGIGCGAVAFDEAQITSKANRAKAEPGLPASTISKHSRMSVAQNVSPTLRSGGNKTGGDRPPGTDVDTADSLIPEICSAVTSKWAHSSGGPSGDECQNLTIAFPERMSGTQRAATAELSCSISAVNPTAIANHQSEIGNGMMAVRRLTPRECERLQGFPDDFTAISFRGKPAADGPRYKALGNSMAVPVIEWILRRMDLVDELVRIETKNESAIYHNYETHAT